MTREPDRQRAVTKRLAIAAAALAMLTSACLGDSDSSSAVASHEDTTALRPAAETTQALELQSAYVDDSAIPVYGGTDIPNDEPYDSTFFDNYG